ncbi:hypothetical protein [Vibrio breoganii]|uniref:hypothetical protein n=1 Tax=Vibrio breoganii TaxID=553239 RepID=UPI000C82D093|nr:hypothetical protein [Vibrio breoganii]PMK16658.1 hypothetical protein BCU06_11745 [Vibrio breoganii]
MTNYFIATKPFQFFNCVNLAVPGDENILIIIPNFAYAKDFYNEILTKNYIWSKVYYIKNKSEIRNVITSLNPKDRVYVDNDLHNQVFKLGPLSKNGLYVYEEGLDIYRINITNVTKSKTKNFIIKLLNILSLYNSNMGGHRKTKGLYTYNLDKYNAVHKNLKHKTLRFPNSFIGNYIRHKDYFDDIFYLSKLDLPKESRVAIYATDNNREVDHLTFLNSLSKDNYDSLIFKPHPNVADLYPDSHYLSTIISEILILAILENGCTIDFYHHGTSSEFYLNHKRLKFIKI